MAHVEDVPVGSIYFWCYRQGLRGVPFNDLVDACFTCNKELREKDIQNYWNGFWNREMRQSSINEICPSMHCSTDVEDLSSFPLSPYKDMPENQARYVPCNASNIPIIKWSQGCMTIASARAMRGCVYLAENMRNTNMIVVDCDGDHDKNKLDFETVAHLIHLYSQTHVLYKPKFGSDYEQEDLPLVFADTPMSFHLTFTTDRVIPTMHFNAAHIDVIGNQRNSLRYFKNKRWNGLAPAPLTQEIWSYIIKWTKHREGRL